MKEKNTFKSILGIAQEDMAIVLGITRSHFAMFGTGKRSLPLDAKQELTRILNYVNEKQFKDEEIQSFLREEEMNIQKNFEKEIQLNEYKIHVLGKKIKKAERLRNENLAALRLAEYLKMQRDDRETDGMSGIIKSQAMAALKKNNELLRKHTISKATLMEQSKIFERELQNEEGFSFFEDAQNEV